MPTPVCAVQNAAISIPAALLRKAAKGQDVYIDSTFGRFKLELDNSEGLEVTPALAKRLAKAEEEIRQGKFTHCETHEDVVRFLDAL
jgi:hypothetical protein